jgi:hypothetical protein
MTPAPTRARPNPDQVADQVVKHFVSATEIEALVSQFAKQYKPMSGSRSPEQLRDTFRTQKRLSKDQVLALMRWKMRNRQEKRLKTNSASRISEITERVARAISADELPSKLAQIATDDLHGIHIAASSTILATWDDRFPIIDVWAWRALHLITKEPFFNRGKRNIFRYDEFDLYVATLRSAARQLGVTPRELDMALYMVGKGSRAPC